MKQKIENVIFKVPERLYIKTIISTLNRFEKESLDDADFINFVLNTFYHLRNYDKIYIIKYVHMWVNNHLTYKEDQYDETLISPRQMINLMEGDCDDFSVFIKTILKFFNIETKYILLGKEYNDYSHIALIYSTSDVSKLIYIDGIVSEFDVYPADYIYNKII